MFTSQTLAYELVTRSLAFVNLFCLGYLHRQVNGLYGPKGLAPMDVTFGRLEIRAQSLAQGSSSAVLWLKRMHLCPSLLWITGQSTMALQWVCLFGCFCAAVVAVGLTAGRAMWSAFFLFLSSFVWLSFVQVGRDFLALQMHATVIETNFIWICGAPFAALGYPGVAVWAMRFLIFRIMLGCGACKYGSGCPTWRNNTAMLFHPWTMPIPNPWSRASFLLPVWAHQLSVLGTFVIEGPACFLVFTNAYGRLLAFLLFVGLNVMINVSGNFGFLGFLTVAQSLSLIDGGQPAAPVLAGRWYAAVVPFAGLLLLLLYIAVSLVPLLDTFYGVFPFGPELLQWIDNRWTRNSLVSRAARVPVRSWQALVSNAWVAKAWYSLALVYGNLRQFRLMNRYAKFANMTKFRYEIVVEGRLDDGDWVEFEFQAKPGKPGSAGKFAHVDFTPGTQFELDWMLWFQSLYVARRSRGNLDLAPYVVEDSFIPRLLIGILERNPAILSLLGPVPPQFRDRAPSQVRVLLYDYKYAGKQAEALYNALHSIFPYKDPFGRAINTDDWDDPPPGVPESQLYWKRKRLGVIFGPVTLKNSNDSDFSEDSSSESDEYSSD